MRKIVINTCYGGFALSKEALDYIIEVKNIDPGVWQQWGYYENFSDLSLSRDDPDLVAVVEKFGEAASADMSSLKIVEIPDNVEWEVMDYDGVEWVAEKHKTWS